ncbi:hypothetical protein C1X64_30930 [Pseudomonas sp. GW456-E7]|nr:hypothetical protein C1X64_30930 [Pseudomonas sp. GW456-E7]
MVVNDAACLLTKRGALESIASKLAPTKFLMNSITSTRAIHEPFRCFAARFGTGPHSPPG